MHGVRRGIWRFGVPIRLLRLDVQHHFLWREDRDFVGWDGSFVRADKAALDRLDSVLGMHLADLTLVYLFDGLAVYEILAHQRGF